MIFIGSATFGGRKTTFFRAFSAALLLAIKIFRETSKFRSRNHQPGYGAQSDRLHDRGEASTRWSSLSPSTPLAKLLEPRSCLDCAAPFSPQQHSKGNLPSPTTNGGFVNEIQHVFLPRTENSEGFVYAHNPSLRDDKVGN